LKLEISGSGAVSFAEIEGRRVTPDADGTLRLPATFNGGRVILHTSQGL
jgi:hypothetical protein